jgi:hypothetical protein
MEIALQVCYTLRPEAVGRRRAEFPKWSKLTIRPSADYPRKLVPQIPYTYKYDDVTERIGDDVTLISDFVTKTAYFSFAAAAVVFVSMLLMTGFHP